MDNIGLKCILFNLLYCFFRGFGFHLTNYCHFFLFWMEHDSLSYFYQLVKRFVGIFFEKLPLSKLKKWFFLTSPINARIVHLHIMTSSKPNKHNSAKFLHFVDLLYFLCGIKYITLTLLIDSNVKHVLDGGISVADMPGSFDPHNNRLHPIILSQHSWAINNKSGGPAPPQNIGGHHWMNALLF